MVLSLIVICFKYINDAKLITLDLKDKYYRFRKIYNSTVQLIFFTQCKFIFKQTIFHINTAQVNETTNKWIFTKNALILKTNINFKQKIYFELQTSLISSYPTIQISCESQYYIFKIKKLLIKMHISRHKTETNIDKIVVECNKIDFPISYCSY